MPIGDGVIGDVIVGDSGGIGYILSADIGSYSVTGSDASLLHGYSLFAEPDSYVSIGSDTSLLKTYIFTAASDEYTVIGYDASLPHGYLISAEIESYAISGLDATLAVTKYTRGNYASLPTDDADLETDYTSQDTVDITVIDNVFVGQVASTEYAIHQFKDYASDADEVSITWRGKTTIAPISSTIHLQIYNRALLTWETIDTDNTTGANYPFTLGSIVHGLEDYKGDSWTISCRVWQLTV